MKTINTTENRFYLFGIVAAVFVLHPTCWFSLAWATGGSSGQIRNYEKNSSNVNVGFSHEDDSCIVYNVDNESNSAPPLTFIRESFQYDVTGYGCGHDVYGMVNDDGYKGVSGYLYLENGKEIVFYGEWVAEGIIEGVDDLGNLYTVKVEN